MPALEPAPGRSAALLARGALALGTWLLLTGAAPADLAAGALTAGAAAWASVRLLPPGRGRLRPGALAAIVLGLLRQAGGAGLDVARRALSPGLPLRPGLVSQPWRLPPGPARDAHCALASLLPGTLPVGSDARGDLLVHCLDVEQPVAARLAADERRLARALGIDADG